MYNGNEIAMKLQLDNMRNFTAGNIFTKIGKFVWGFFFYFFCDIKLVDKLLLRVFFYVKSIFMYLIIPHTRYEFITEIL